MKRLVLLGGGHAHVHVLAALARQPIKCAEPVLISPFARQIYSGMLPSWTAGHYHIDQCAIPIEALARRGGCRFIQTLGVGLDLSKREVLCADGSRVGYDLLSIDVGPAARTGELSGGESALSVRPLESFVSGWPSLLDRVKAEGKASLAVVGGGASGVELAFAMQYRLAEEIGEANTGVRLISVNSELLPEYPEKIRIRLSQVLESRGISLVTEQRASGIEAEGVRLQDGGLIGARNAVVATGSTAPAWPRISGLEVDEQGFIMTDEHLNAVGHPEIFAAGDIATMTGHPRPKSGIYAVRAGPPLWKNLQLMLRNARLHAYKPPNEALYLISTGDQYAVASWGSVIWEGRWVWSWKDRIDRQFISHYQSVG